jgi:hypothetical protein
MFTGTAGAEPAETGIGVDPRPGGPRCLARPGGSLHVYCPDGVTPIPAFTAWRSSGVRVLA